MASDGKLVADSIEEMLVSLAEGVREAQEALNALAPFDSFGRASPGYFIPHLDFELEVDIETETNNAGRPIFKVLAARAGSASSSSSSKSHTTSRLSGRIIAVPPGEGLPIPQLALSAESATGAVSTLTVTATNSAGERLAGQQIELNIDVEASKALSRGASPALPDARLKDALLVTDDQGQASTTLTVSSGGGQGKLLLVVAQYGTASARVMVGTGG
ncbi:MAG: hypothetical protein V4574_09150 [Pseudomonadota bacterium]